MMLEAFDIKVSLGGKPVLTGVSLTVGAGGWLGVVGPNGAGKSTLLRALLGLVPYQGNVRVCGREYGQGEQRSRARALAYVPQRPVLPAAMNVVDYVLLGRSAHHSYLGPETARDLEVTAEVLERLELLPLASRPLSQLSGGEAQRAVLARALAQEAPVLVMDEPTTSLDLGYGQLVLELADELRKQKGLAVVCAIHDLTLAAQFSDQLMLLSTGRAVSFGPPGQVLTEANVRRYFGADVEILIGECGLVVSPARRRRPKEALGTCPLAQGT
jgi:iron complex transport system ATP-binding protein